MAPPRSRWILFWLLVWLVTCYYLGPATAQQNGGQVVKILAIFDQADLEMMTRVLHKTLAALNKENSRPQWRNVSSSTVLRRDRRDTNQPLDKAQKWTLSPSPPLSTQLNMIKVRLNEISKSTSQPTTGQLAAGLKKARGKSRLKMEAIVFAGPWWINQSAEDLCALFLRHNPIAVLALAEDKVMLRVALAASAFNVPIIGTRTSRDLDDASFQEISRFYVGLNPSPHHLVSALHHLLSANHWFPMTLIVDDSPYAQRIRRVIQSADPFINQTLAEFDTKLMVVTMDRRWPRHRILAQLGGIQQTTSLVIAVCCDTQLTSVIFQEAQSVNMLNGEWIWIALEDTARRPSPADGTDWSTALPVGLLGLVSQPSKLSKHSMKGSLAILHSAVQSLALDEIRSWDADVSAGVAASNGNANRVKTNDETRWTCTKPHSVRYNLAKKLYNEIHWRVKEALAGRLTYDGGGKIDSALQANFDVINLVPRGPFYPARGHVLPSSSRQRRAVSSNSSNWTPIQTSTKELDEDETEDDAMWEEEMEHLEESHLDLSKSSNGMEPSTLWSQTPFNGPAQHPVDQFNDGNDQPLTNYGAIHLDATHFASDAKIWQLVGNVSGQAVSFKGVLWPGGGLTGPRGHSRQLYRVATVFSPPFVMETEVFNEDDETRCLTGIPCLRVNTNQKDEIARIFGEYERNVNAGISYNVTCCYGFSIDLMQNVANDLDFKFQVYVVADGQCGAKRSSKWDGIIADLRSGAAHLSFAPLSVTSGRSEVIDFTIPFFYSGLSILEATRNEDVPLLAFLKPFGADLWIGIFISLNVTAVTVAIYEWLSPFGLNPWGRQRTKNFSLASALWVMWSLLFSHLVAFKAPKSWPNKFLINVWGGFSVIFLASYTANIAALFTGVFSQTSVTTFQDPRLLTQKVGTTRSSAADNYAYKTDRKLWEHLQKFTVPTLEDGVAKLRNGTLDLLIGDTPILDYYRANDPGCTLRTVDAIEEDNYAVGISKGHPFLQTKISSKISQYSTSGYMDELRTKWYSSLPCFRSPNDAYRPQALGVSAVAGVFILLGFGILAGCLILILEHLVYKYALPRLRRQPKGTIWRSPNMMFFSQKLYRFINCVELLSPHHAAKELMNSLRQGQITSLFQKSVKRKENEQRRRRKSKAQFFEMIQEIRRSQKEERDVDDEDDEDVDNHDDVEDEGGGESEEDDDIDDGGKRHDGGNSRRVLQRELVDKRRPDVIEDRASDSPNHSKAYPGRKEPSSLVECRLRLDVQPVVSSNQNEADTRIKETEHRACLQHSPTTAADLGSHTIDPAGQISHSSRLVKNMTSIRRRTSFSVDALPGSGCITGPWPPRDIMDEDGLQGLDDLMLSTSSSSASETDEEGRATSSSKRICSSMVDRTTLMKLTKEDLLLLWQAAEAEWARKLGKTKNQRDALLLRLKRRAKTRPDAGCLASGSQRQAYPSPFASSPFRKYGYSD